MTDDSQLISAALERALVKFREGRPDSGSGGALQLMVKEALVACAAARDDERRTLASGLRKFAPDLADELMTRWRAAPPELDWELASLMEALLSEALVDQPSDARGIAVGDSVRKKGGYLWPGKVVSVFSNLRGHTRVVVECTVPEVAGALHIFLPENIEPV